MSNKPTTRARRRATAKAAMDRVTRRRPAPGRANKSTSPVVSNFADLKTDPLTAEQTAKFIAPFKPSHWYVAKVLSVEFGLGAGFHANQQVVFKVWVHEGQPVVVVYNLNYAIRQLNAAQARHSLETQKIRHTDKTVSLVSYPNQVEVEDKYQWELNA